MFTLTKIFSPYFIIYNISSFNVGKKSDDPNNPDFVPSRFSYRQQSSSSSQKQKVERYKRVTARRSTHFHDVDSDSKSNNDEAELMEPIDTVIKESGIFEFFY